MIQLFDIPSCEINLNSRSNFLYGPRVTEFEEEFADYVGANYACSFNSASSAIFLALRMVIDNWPSFLNNSKRIFIPSAIPPVVPNMMINSGANIEFVDDIEWIGHNYTLADFESFKIIDSAQAVERQIFKRDANPNDLMIFSFYPTKPVGGIDGGMIVSDDKSKIEYLKKMSMNGTGSSINSWERSLEQIGWKMYMNCAQTQVAYQSLRSLSRKINKLDKLRKHYNDKLLIVPKPNSKGQNGYHLYRIYVNNNIRFINIAKDEGIICGIHYQALHSHPLYGKYSIAERSYKASNTVHAHSVSIPFHANLNIEETDEITTFILAYQDKHGRPDC